MTARILHGDCLEQMRALAAESVTVQAIVTDPPYGIDFMGKAWDSAATVAFQAETWRLAFDLLPPGGHLLAFSGTRTYHRMVCAIEDAGFEIRDQIGWVYGTGFPKSLDVGKAIDRAAGAEREVVGPRVRLGDARAYAHNAAPTIGAVGHAAGDVSITAPATEAARQWQGWGTALKPAWEPIVVARKPLQGTVAANVLAHGTGAINVDACRVAGTVTTNPLVRNAGGFQSNGLANQGETGRGVVSEGRWPANIVHDGSDEVEAAFAAFGEKKAGVAVKRNLDGRTYNAHQEWGMKARVGQDVGFGGEGTASRFFYSAKASAADRCDSKHPTVKPVSLMRWLVRMVTPPGGTVLDPFAGSGTTLAAATLEGFDSIGIEREEEYYTDICRRLALLNQTEPDEGAELQMDLFGDVA